MKQDNVLPEDKWEFNEEVSGVFDNMLSRSIPDYATMRHLVTEIASTYYWKNRGTIADLGCSNGAGLQPIIDKLGVQARYYGCDVSIPMLNECKKRFAPYIESDGAGAIPMRIEERDLMDGIPNITYSAIMSVLTLQFTPIEHRMHILNDIRQNLTPGQCFILVEKVLGHSASLDKTMIDTYYDMKRENGYTNEQIERKRLSLQGVLVPVTAHMNEEFLRMAGFREIDCFWRWMNFAGWIAIP
jgi:tRNA (cmo5U34)-methyltransferase